MWYTTQKFCILLYTVYVLERLNGSKAFAMIMQHSKLANICVHMYSHNNSQQVLKAKACLDDVQRRIPHPSWHSMSSSGMVQKSCTLADQPAIIKCR